MGVHVDYIEVSSKDSSNVKSTFDRMVEKMYAGVDSSYLMESESVAEFHEFIKNKYGGGRGGQGVLLSKQSDTSSLLPVLAVVKNKSSAAQSTALRLYIYESYIYSSTIQIMERGRGAFLAKESKRMFFILYIIFIL